jgi:hypothetical protein
MLSQTINTQLTDDFNGKDFETYKAILKRSQIAGRYHPLNKKMINIQTVKTYNPDGNEFQLYVNDNQVKINDENLGLISFVSKLLKRIAKEKPDKFEINNDFIEGEEPALATSIGTNLREVFDDEYKYKEFLQSAYEPTAIKGVSKEEFNDIQKCMEEYFE